GVTFYLLLALFPALAAFVSIYGFVADPLTVAEHLDVLDGVLPADGADLIETQLQSLARQDAGALSFGFIFGLLVALWSANSGMKAIFDAMNVVYEEDEKRGFIKYNLMSLAFTLGGLVAAIFFIILIGVVPAVLAFLHLEGITELLIRILRWPLMLVAVALVFSLIYRWAPSRRKAKWRWVSWGSALAAICWLPVAAGFSADLARV